MEKSVERDNSKMSLRVLNKFPRIVTKSKSWILEEISNEVLGLFHRLYGNEIYVTDKQIKEWEDVCYTDLQRELDKFMSKYGMEYVGSCLAIIWLPEQRRSLYLEIFWSRLDLKSILEYIYVCAFAERLVDIKYEVSPYFCRVHIRDFNLRFKEENEKIHLFLPEEYTKKENVRYGMELVSIVKILKITNSYIKSSISSIVKNAGRVGRIIDVVEKSVGKEIEINSDDHIFVSSLAHRFRKYQANEQAKSVIFYDPIPMKGVVTHMILFKDRVYYFLEWRKSVLLNPENSSKIRNLWKNFTENFSRLSKFEIHKVLSVLFMTSDQDSGLKFAKKWDPKMLDPI